MYDQWFIDFISKFEDFRPKSEKDVNGKWVIGYGSLTYSDGTPVKEGDTITKEEAIKLIPDYLTRNAPLYLKSFSNWDKMPKLVLYGIMNFAYRGGPNNFRLKSPKFAKAINDAYADGKLTLKEYLNIIKEMNFSLKGNLLDRSERAAAMLANSYNPDDNSTIGHATTRKSPYHNYHNNVFYSGNLYNSIFHTNLSNANFVKRLLDSNREFINLENGQIGTHLLSYKTTDDGYDIIYPLIQQKTRKLLFKDPTYTNGLILLTDDEAWKIALLMGDTIHVPAGMGEEFTTKYKQYYPGFKKGGTINYLNFFK